MLLHCSFQSIGRHRCGEFLSSRPAFRRCSQSSRLTCFLVYPVSSLDQLARISKQEDPARKQSQCPTLSSRGQSARRQTSWRRAKYVVAMSYSMFRQVTRVFFYSENHRQGACHQSPGSRRRSWQRHIRQWLEGWCSTDQRVRALVTFGQFSDDHACFSCVLVQWNAVI